jgi:accessory gene regulator protein AgrB
LFDCTVSSILHWNDPVQSALLFGIGNFFFFLITYGDYTVLSLFAYLDLALLFVAGVYANGTLLRAYLKKEKYENPFSYVINLPLSMLWAKFDAQASNLAFIGSWLIFVW